MSRVKMKRIYTLLCIIGPLKEQEESPVKLVDGHEKVATGVVHVHIYLLVSYFLSVKRTLVVERTLAQQTACH